MIKNGAKKRAYLPRLFCFHQKKSAANTQNYLRYGKNVIKCYKMFKRMRIGLNDLKKR